MRRARLVRNGGRAAHQSKPAGSTGADDGDRPVGGVGRSVAERAVEVRAPAVGERGHGLAAGMEPPGAQLREAETADHRYRAELSVHRRTVAELAVSVRSPAIGPLALGFSARMSFADCHPREVQPSRDGSGGPGEPLIAAAELTIEAISPTEGLVRGRDGTRGVPTGAELPKEAGACDADGRGIEHSGRVVTRLALLVIAPAIGETVQRDPAGMEVPRVH